MPSALRRGCGRGLEEVRRWYDVPDLRAALVVGDKVVAASVVVEGDSTATPAGDHRRRRGEQLRLGELDRGGIREQAGLTRSNRAVSRSNASAELHD